MRGVLNGGAYADIGPRVTHKSGFTAAGPYDIDNVWIDSFAMYTNLTPAGALRGFGMPQLTFAYESHTDMVARALKIDPLEFRLRNNVLRNATAAGDRHDPERCGARARARTRRRAAALERKIRSRQRYGQARPRDCLRTQGLRLADRVGCHRQCRRRRRRHALHLDRRHGARFRYRHGADGRRGAQHAGRVGAGRRPRQPT